MPDMLGYLLLFTGVGVAFIFVNLTVGKFIRPARIGVRFGPPFELTQLYERNDKGEAMEQALGEIKERIEALHS